MCNELASSVNVKHLIGENMRLHKDVAHWKANHDCIKTRLQFALQRPDLPADRIPAYEMMQTEIERLQREIERLKEDGLTAAYLDGVEYGKRMMVAQVEKIATNNWLGGK